MAAVCASVELGLNGSSPRVLINVSAIEQTQNNVTVYWIIPECAILNAMSGEYTSNGTLGDVMWWTFDDVSPNESKHIVLDLSGCASSEAYVLGIDPKGK